jgi:hypothetical protein
MLTEWQRRRRGLQSNFGATTAKHHAVRELKKSMDFASLGFEFDPQFTDEDRGCRFVSKTFPMPTLEHRLRVAVNVSVDGSWEVAGSQLDTHSSGTTAKRSIQFRLRCPAELSTIDGTFPLRQRGRRGGG